MGRAWAKDFKDLRKTRPDRPTIFWPNRPGHRTLSWAFCWPDLARLENMPGIVSTILRAREKKMQTVLISWVSDHKSHTKTEHGMNKKVLCNFMAFLQQNVHTAWVCIAVISRPSHRGADRGDTLCRCAHGQLGCARCQKHRRFHPRLALSIFSVGSSSAALPSCRR
jgi:hypothetical protein